MTTGKLTEGRRMDCEDENAKLLAEFEKDLDMELILRV